MKGREEGREEMIRNKAMNEAEMAGGMQRGATALHTKTDERAHTHTHAPIHASDDHVTPAPMAYASSTPMVTACAPAQRLWGAKGTKAHGRG